VGNRRLWGGLETVIQLIAFLALVAAVLYLRLFRPWQLRWGATDTEVSRSLPGDDLLGKPTFNATRAITIDARPENVWSWLVQVGVKRGGWYSYDLLDNLGHPSARSIIPSLQNIGVGDVLAMSPDGKQGMHVIALDPPRSMIWGTPGQTTWAWVLDPLPEGGTRVITRVRAVYHWMSPTIVFSMLIEFADIWMIRKMLLNVKQRAESRERVEVLAARLALGR
jgi:hypothetical protein